MARKNIMRLRGKACADGIRLTFYKGTPLFQGGAAEPTLSILRLETPDFVFGGDYEEFFDGLDPEGADTIFTGSLPTTNKRKYSYLDATAEIGKTYAYWVGVAGDGMPVGPLPMKRRDPQVWWSQAEIDARITALATAFPGQVSCENVGKTVRGIPLTGILAGNRDNMLALVGVIHAGESGPELMLPVLEKLLRERPELLEKSGLALLPSVNADGREREVCGEPWYIRCNANRVDLNRNFDADWEQVALGYGLDSSDPDAMTYRGPTPESEPETRAVLKFLEVVRPRAVFSFHCLASICGDSFLVSKDAGDNAEFSALASRFATAYQRGMYPEKGQASLSCACASGSLPHFLYRRGIPCFDLELGTNEDARPCVRDETTPELLEVYQQRHFGGVCAALEELSRADGDSRL